MPRKLWTQTQDIVKRKFTSLMLLLENNELIDHYVQKLDLNVLNDN